jgi:hypothetical protein
MKRFSYFLILLINNFLYSQEIKITVVDSLNQSPIQEAITLNSEGQFISKSNELGVFLIDANRNNFIYVVANGYEQIQISPTQNTDLICKLIKNRKYSMK